MNSTKLSVKSMLNAPRYFKHYKCRNSNKTQAAALIVLILTAHLPETRHTLQKFCFQKKKEKTPLLSRNCAAL